MRVVVCLVFGLAVFAGVFGCNPDKGGQTNKTVFNYNEMNGVSSLDPAAASNFENISIVNQLYNGLVEADKNLAISLCIARKYAISADGKLYTFTLRSNVYFHDNSCFTGNKGRKVSAADFVYSFERLLDSKVSTAGNIMNLFDLTGSAGPAFEATNDSTFIVRLAKPFSGFLNVLSMKYFSVVPKEAVDFYKADFRSNPVGTGPFKFKIWQEGSKLVLVKNETYFEKDSQGVQLPYLDAMTVSFMKDKETAFMELLNGKFDMLSGADAFNASEVLDKEAQLRPDYKDRFILQRSNFLKTDYIGILVDEKIEQVKLSPLRLKTIRQAINYAIDRKKMIKYLRQNLGTAATAGFIPPGLPAYDTSAVRGYHYNPAKTAELLKQAGFEGGKKMPEITLYTTENYKSQAEFIQSELAKNNIVIQISVEKPSVLRQAVNRGEYMFFRKSWVADYADEENFMSLFYSKNFCPKGINFFHYENSQFDRLYETALTEQNPHIRKQLYNTMDSIILSDAPVITLFYDDVIRLVRPCISGLETNPMNMLDLKRVKKSVN